MADLRSAIPPHSDDFIVNGESESLHLPMFRPKLCTDLFLLRMAGQ